jgi:hypothetical protein
MQAIFTICGMVDYVTLFIQAFLNEAGRGGIVFN